MLLEQKNWKTWR